MTQFGNLSFSRCIKSKVILRTHDFKDDRANCFLLILSLSNTLNKLCFLFILVCEPSGYCVGNKWSVVLTTVREVVTLI